MSLHKKEELTDEERDLLTYYRMLDKEGRLILMGCAAEEMQRSEKEAIRQRRMAAGADYQRGALHIVRGGAENG